MAAAAARRSRSPVRHEDRELTPLETLPRGKDLPGHFLHPKGYNLSTSTVKVGESLWKLYECPSHVDECEWLAYHLHFLVERTIILFDYMQFHCRDGVTRIDYDSPIDYALPIDMSRFTDASKAAYHSPVDHCKHYVRVGDRKILNTDEIQMTIEENEAPNQRYQILLNEPDEIGGTPLGASTYIWRVLQYLKTLRTNIFFFPRRKEQDIREAAFKACARFMLYHLINIMSHYVSYHTEDAYKGGITNQLFSLFLSVFVIAEKNRMIPPRECVDEDVISLFRHLKYVDENVYGHIPDIAYLFAAAAGTV